MTLTLGDVYRKKDGGAGRRLVVNFWGKPEAYRVSESPWGPMVHYQDGISAAEIKRAWVRMGTAAEIFVNEDRDG